MRTMRILKLAVIAAGVLLTDNALAQGCASCYTTAAAGGAQIIHALRNGILVLLVPPALMFTGLLFVLYRWRAISESGQHLPNRNRSVNLQNNPH